MMTFLLSENMGADRRVADRWKNCIGATLHFMKSLDLIFSSWFALWRWKHAAACHHDSTLEGEGDYYETDAVWAKLMTLQTEGGA